MLSALEEETSALIDENYFEIVDQSKLKRVLIKNGFKRIWSIFAFPSKKTITNPGNLQKRCVCV